MKRKVIHITHQLGGGTQKYIDELVILYPEYDHIVLTSLPASINPDLVHQTRLVHIHAAVIGSNIGWNILNIADYFKRNNTQVYLTIHDYQWIFPDNPGLSLEDIQNGIKPDKTNLDNCTKLLDTVDKIIVPSQRLFDNYHAFLNYMPSCCYIVKHNDIPIRYEQLVVNKVDDTINVAFVGYSAPHKGILQLYKLANVLKMYYDKKVIFHLFGGPSVLDMDNVVAHGNYNDKELISTLHSKNIHLVLMLSVSEETYCYSLSRIINSGLPIVYFNRGSLLTRLSPLIPRFFPCENNILRLQEQTIRAIEYIISNQEKKDYIEMKEDTELNEWYENNYLV